MWLKVHSIEVVTIQVASEHTFKYTLRIDHWNNIKMEVFAKEIRAIVVFVEEETNDSLHTMRSWSLTRMHSG